MSESDFHLCRAQGAAPLAVLGTAVRFVGPAALSGGGWSLMHVTVPKGSGPPPHHHAWGEAYYVTGGTLRFTLGGTVVDLAAGDFLYAPPDTLHGFVGTSETSAQVLILDAPAQAEGFFHAVHAAGDRALAPPQVAAIGAAHGIHFVPPAP